MIVALLTSVVSLYYYAGIMRVMYFDASKNEAPGLSIPLGTKTALWLAAAGTFVGKSVFAAWAIAGIPALDARWTANAGALGASCGVMQRQPRDTRPEKGQG